jgi:hypothetical protein
MIFDVRPYIGGSSVCVLIARMTGLPYQFGDNQLRVVSALAESVQTVQQVLQLLGYLHLVLLF